VGDNGAAYGIAQWENAKDEPHGRRYHLEKYTGTSTPNLGQQEEYLVYDLTHNYAGTYRALQQATTTTQAADTFSGGFEGCGVCMDTNRENYAAKILIYAHKHNW
jgi:hypothetical protein